MHTKVAPFVMPVYTTLRKVLNLEVAMTCANRIRALIARRSLTVQGRSKHPASAINYNESAQDFEDWSEGMVPQAHTMTATLTSAERPLVEAVYWVFQCTQTLRHSTHHSSAA